MTQDKIIKAIWRAVNAHFIVTNAVTLNANLKYESNQTIAQVMAIGLCNQYGIDRADVEDLLCIEPSGYDNKLQVFNTLTKSSVDAGNSETLKDWKMRLAMCSRHVRRNLVESYKV